LNLGLYRLKTLLSRLNVISNSDDASIIATYDDANNVRSLKLKANKTSLDYRCAMISDDGKKLNNKMIPKGINDVLNWNIDIPGESVSILQSGIASMTRATKIALTYNNEVLSFECSDENNDTFKTEISGEMTWINEKEDTPATSFCHYYPDKVLNSLFKAAIADNKSNVNVSLGSKGILIMTINGLDFYILPITG
jgi:hypothetical protein